MLEKVKGVRTTFVISFSLLLIFVSLWINKMPPENVVSLLQVLLPTYFGAKVGFKVAEAKAGKSEKTQ